MKKRILLGLATATTLAMFAPTTAEAMEWFNQLDIPVTAEYGDYWTRNVGDGEDTFRYEGSKWELISSTSERRKVAIEEQNALARQREEVRRKLEELRDSYMENAMENPDYYKDSPENEVEYVYISRIAMTPSGTKRFNGTVRIPKVNIPERIPEYYGSVYVDENLPELLPIVNVQPEYIPENENKEENNSEKHDEENNSSSITKNNSTEENNDSDKNNDAEIDDHSNDKVEANKESVEKDDFSATNNNDSNTMSNEVDTENNNNSNNITVNTKENNDVTNDNPTSTDAGKTSIDNSNSDNDTTNINNSSNSADKTGDKKDTSTKTENNNSKNTDNTSNTINSNSNVGSSSKATSENTSTTTSSSSNTDKKLPKAGTNNNYTLFGFSFAMLSGIVMFINKKRKNLL